MQNLLNILRLVEFCEPIDGRKKFQKLVHILQECGYPFREQFSFHLFGPYSSDLKREIDTLEGELLAETAEESNEITRYVYHLTEAAKTLLAQRADAQSAAWKDLAQSLNARSALDLEAISTLLFLKKRGYEGQRLQTRFGELKPNLATQFERANRDAESLVANKRLAS
ncbi:MAG: YwgA family protein [Phycisphaerales bacterium]